MNDNYSTGFGVTLNGTTVLVNDTDMDGVSLTVNIIPVSGPSNGAIVIAANGTFTYTPNAGFIGIDSLVYQVCDGGTPSQCDSATIYITVGINSAPVAVNDSYTTPEDNTLTTTTVNGVLINDTDVNGNTLTVIGFDALSTSGGTVVVNPDGTFTYTPLPNFNGTDTFTYIISDGFGGTDTFTYIISDGFGVPPSHT